MLPVKQQRERQRDSVSTRERYINCHVAGKHHKVCVRERVWVCVRERERELEKKNQTRTIDNKLKLKCSTHVCL